MDCEEEVLTAASPVVLKEEVGVQWGACYPSGCMYLKNQKVSISRLVCLFSSFCPRET